MKPSRSMLPLGRARALPAKLKLTGSKSSEAVKFLRHGFASLRARTRDAAVPGLGAALGLWTMSRLGPGCESLGKDHRSKASNLVRVEAARG